MGLRLGQDVVVQFRPRFEKDPQRVRAAKVIRVREDQDPDLFVYLTEDDGDISMAPFIRLNLVRQGPGDRQFSLVPVK